MKKHKCKDYFIIKVGYYASDYLMKKWHKTDIFPKQHQNRAIQHTNFFWDLTEFITEKDSKWWTIEYMMRSKDCAMEELEDEYSILCQHNEGWYTYLIPIEYNHIVEWIKSNISKYELPYKIIKKIRGISFYNYERDLRYNRRTAGEFVSKLKQEDPETYKNWKH